MNRAPHIRRIRASEVAAERSLRLRALRTDPSAFGSTYAQEIAFPEERWTGRTVAGATSSTQSTWVAEAADGELVGSVTIVRGDDRRFGVFGMWVAPVERGRGLGDRLLTAALRWAKESDPTAACWLDVNPRQEAALHLYERHGFRRTGKSKTLEHTDGDIAVEMVRPPGA